MFKLKRIEAERDCYIVGHVIHNKENDLRICADYKEVNLVVNGKKVDTLFTDGNIQVMNTAQFRSFLKDLNNEYEELPTDLEVAKIISPKGYYEFNVFNRAVPLKLPKWKNTDTLSRNFGVDIQSSEYTVNITLPKGSEFDSILSLRDSEELFLCQD